MRRDTEFSEFFAARGPTLRRTAYLIVRDWHRILSYRLSDDGHCLQCGRAIAGRFRHFEGAFGQRRIPVRLSA